MTDIVTEQWIQIQRLEQALYITQVSISYLKLASDSVLDEFVSITEMDFDDSLIFIGLIRQGL